MANQEQVKNSSAVERPLSPHLQIYRWQITMIMSILHRGTGIVLTFALAILAWWLVALATGAEAYAFFTMCAAHPFGVFVLVGLSFAMFLHCCTGIRHIMMDTGRGFKIPQIYASGYTALGAAILLTAGFWFLVFG